MSSTDPEARGVKMADGGFRPAFNLQLAVDVATQMVVGVDLVNLGSDQSQMVPMYDQLAERYEIAPGYWLTDGGYTNLDAIETLDATGTKVIAPAQASRNPDVDRYAPKPGDSEPTRRWWMRMQRDETAEIYELRAASVECVNSHARRRGLRQLPLRGAVNNRCVGLWHSLAHNLVRMQRLGFLAPV